MRIISFSKRIEEKEENVVNFDYTTAQTIDLRRNRIQFENKCNKKKRNEISLNQLKM